MTKEELFEKVNEFAKAHSMECKLGQFGLCGNGDWSISVSYKFSDGLYINRRSEIYHIREVSDGKVNYWHEVIHDCKHHITGPGYRGSRSEQEPVTLDKICRRFIKELGDSFVYYNP